MSNQKIKLFLYAINVHVTNQMVIIEEDVNKYLNDNPDWFLVDKKTNTNLDGRLYYTITLTMQKKE